VHSSRGYFVSSGLFVFAADPVVFALRETGPKVPSYQRQFVAGRLCHVSSKLSGFASRPCGVKPWTSSPRFSSFSLGWPTGFNFTYVILGFVIPARSLPPFRADRATGDGASCCPLTYTLAFGDALDGLLPASMMPGMCGGSITALRSTFPCAPSSMMNRRF